VNVPVEQPATVVENVKAPVAMVPRYASDPFPIMVPLVEPDVNATDTFKLDPVPDVTCPVTLKFVPVAAIAGKHDEGGLFTAVTVPVIVLPFWLKLAVRVVLGGAVP